jgi:Fe2+ transport system protein FeoA
MKLSDLNIHDKSVVVVIHSDNELKKRLHSFGIFKGSEIIVENVSLSKNTMTIEIEHTSIALRIDEAQTIEVRKIV